MAIVMDRKVALITGGSRGIGASAAKLLAAKGWAVAINYRADKAAAEATAKAVEAAGGEGEFVLEAGKIYAMASNISVAEGKVLKITGAEADGVQKASLQPFPLADGSLGFGGDAGPGEMFWTAGDGAELHLDNLLLKLAGQIDPDCKQASADGGRIGLKTIGSPNVCITKARNYMSEELTKGIGTQQNAKTSLIKRILSGSANFLKQNLSPKELFKMENLIGKPALYGAAAFETALVADDVLRKGKPLNVAAAESLFGSVLNLDADAARAKNLLESNTQLSPAAKELLDKPVRLTACIRPDVLPALVALFISVNVMSLELLSAELKSPE